MKIILVGASGTIGKTLHAHFSKNHEVIRAGRKGADVQLDMSDPASIRAMYEKVGRFDALVCAAGHAYFGPFADMTEEQFYIGIKSKMMGQINLVLEGMKKIADKGSFTLISGITANDPIPAGVAAGTVNGALEAFTFASSIVMPRGLRINVVSPGLVEDSAHLGAAFPGHIPVSMERVAKGYEKSVLGAVTGQVIRVQ